MPDDPVDASGSYSNILEPSTMYSVSLSGIILSMPGYIKPHIWLKVI